MCLWEELAEISVARRAAAFALHLRAHVHRVPGCVQVLHERCLNCCRAPSVCMPAGDRACARACVRACVRLQVASTIREDFNTPTAHRERNVSPKASETETHPQDDGSASWGWGGGSSDRTGKEIDEALCKLTSAEPNEMQGTIGRDGNTATRYSMSVDKEDEDLFFTPESTPIKQGGSRQAVPGLPSSSGSAPPPNTDSEHEGSCKFKHSNGKLDIRLARHSARKDHSQAPPTKSASNLASPLVFNGGQIVALRTALTAFYMENAPGKLHKVEGMMKTFLQKGCDLAQAELINKSLQSCYGRSLDLEKEVLSGRESISLRASRELFAGVCEVLQVEPAERDGPAPSRQSLDALEGSTI
jgi:hypothetical protein